MTTRDLPTGIRQTPTGYHVFVWVREPRYPKGHNRSKRFKADATLAAMKQWREDQRVDARRQPLQTTIRAEGFAANALTYLEAVRAMPSYKDRCRQIREWVAIFGNTPSTDITSTPIRAARDRWLTIGPKRIQTLGPDGKRTWVDHKTPLSPSTVNQRLRALENLWTVLWPTAPNPVREVPEADETASQQPRGQSFALALEILAHMPDRTAPVKGGTHEPGSLSRVRFEAMLWTGLPAVQLGTLQPEMVDWVRGTVLPLKRFKGRSSRRAGRRRVERPRPLLPQAIAALKQFFALKANRPFSSTSLARSVRRSITAANVERTTKGLPLIPLTLRVYDLTRHTFGTEAFRATKSEQAVDELLGSKQGHRYARAAIQEHAIAAIQELTTIANRAQRSRRGRNRTGVLTTAKTTERIRARRQPPEP